MNMQQDDRTLEELKRDYLSDESAAEFDRTVAAAAIRRRRTVTWGSMMAVAASAALILTLKTQGRCEFDGLEIAEGIERILELDAGDIDSVTAKPDGNRVVLTARMTDGHTCLYVMRREDGASAISITALNNLKNK